MTGNVFSPIVVKSERVVRLTAACIQAAIRLRLNVSIPFSDAIDLARVHDVRSAVEGVRSKLQVHEAVPQSIRLKIAVSEAKLSDSVTGQESTEHILNVRNTTFENMVPETNDTSASIVRGLEAIVRDAAEWVGEYRRFSDDLLAIYRDGTRRLNQLPLTFERRAQARSELESIIADAFKRAQGV
jgi:hypothetical protein